MESFYSAVQAACPRLWPLSDDEKALETRWKTATTAGNHAWLEQDHREALRHYQEALFEMALMGGSPLLAPMAFNISCANVAEISARVSGRQTAAGWLLRAFDRLAAVADSATTPVGLRVNCIRHLRYPLQLMARDFATELPQIGSGDLFARADRVAGEVQRIAIWMISAAPAGSQGDGCPAASRLN
jgi:hypothetical protein